MNYKALATAIALTASVSFLPGTAAAQVTTVNFGGAYNGGPLEGQAFTGTFAYDASTAASSAFDYFNDGTIDQFNYNDFSLISPFTITDTTGTKSVTTANLILRNNDPYTSGNPDIFYLIGLLPANESFEFYFTTSNKTFIENGLPVSFPALSAIAGGYGYTSTSGQGNLTSLTASVAVEPSVSAVPEPATWAMMIAGFGAVGGSLRRRRQPALATV